MAAMEQQVAALQIELAQSQQHVARLGAAIDELRNESSTAVANLRQQLAEQHNRDRHDDRRDLKGKKLINVKNTEPKHFGGRDDENYKEKKKTTD